MFVVKLINHVSQSIYYDSLTYSVIAYTDIRE